MLDSLRSVSNDIRPGQALAQAQLERLVETVAATVDLEPRIRHVAGQRFWDRLIDLDEVEVWLICWMHDTDTGFHDHDRSSGAVHVVNGTLAQDRLLLNGNGTSMTTIHPAGTTFTFGEGHIHRMHHIGSEPAVSLHAYSPRIVRLGAYTVGSDGELVRMTIPGDAELRPLSAAS